MFFIFLIVNSKFILNMNFFEQLVIPPTAENMPLLNLVQIVSFAVFYPFLGMLIGGTFLSLLFNYLGNKKNNGIYKMFANDVIMKLTVSRNAGYALIILPVVSIAIVFSQFLYSSNVISVSLFFVSSLVYLIAVIYVYKYRAGFQISSVLSSFKSIVKEEKIPDEVKIFEEKTLSEKSRYGKLGFILLIVATFLFTGSMTVAGNIQEWKDFPTILSVLFSGKVWLNFIDFLIFAFAFSGASIMFFFFDWQGGISFENGKYKDFVRKFSGSLTLISVLVLPVLLFLSFIILPRQAYSSSVFVFSGFAFFCLLLAGNFAYAILKNSEIRYSTGVFFSILLAIIFIVVKNQFAFDNSVKTHTVAVNQKAEEILKEKLPETKKIVEINGEDIYKGRCAACHKFDVKLVGPPYKETLPKYNGDIKKLAGYIYNPVKINPEYPPMPNQGLKMAEAEAVAKFLLEKYQK